MERMLAAASATKSSFESESGAALEAKNKELKESAMSVQESKAAAEEAWRQLTMLTAERDGLLRKVAEAERASHALSQLEGDREEGAQAVAAERSAHEKTKREIVQLQGSISSLETQNVSYARLLATTQKSLEERNVAYAALAPKNRELTQRSTEQQKALEDARAECAQLQAQLTEAVKAKEQARSALKNKEQEADELSKQLTMAEEAAAGRIASGAGEGDGSNSDNGDSGNAHGAGLEARLEALQEALATKVAELARVSSERTALQLRCDKQEKAAREQELLIASSRSWGQEPAGSSPAPKYGVGGSGGVPTGDGSPTGWALGDGPSSYNRRRRMVGRDGGGVSEGRLVENPLLTAAGSGKRAAGVRKAAALFDSTSLWAVGMLRRYAALRLLMMAYILWLHLWALFVLDWAVDMEQEEEGMEHKAAAFIRNSPEAAAGIELPAGAATAPLPMDDRH